MKVSVIIPNYNHAVYLPRRIESVLQQTYDDIEVIILDDCSSDGSEEVIKVFVASDARITFVPNDKNSGSVFKQWSKGLSLSTGEYIWIAESDDFAEVDFLSTLVPIMEQNDSVSFAYTNSLIVNEKDEAIKPISVLKKQIFSTEHWDHDFLANGRQELSHYLSLQCTVNNASAVLFRRSSIEAAGGVDTTFRYTGDWLMYIKLSLQGNIAYHARCLNNYREHQVNASKKSLADGSQLLERQKCFAFIAGTASLDSKNLKNMMSQASAEYSDLLNHIIGREKNFTKLAQMIKQLVRISPSYCLQIQFEALRRYRSIKSTRLASKFKNYLKPGSERQL